MKRVFFLAILSLLLFSCEKPVSEHKSSNIAVLQIDYTTYAFEGGTELTYNQALSGSDSIPVLVDYKSPGDFGSLTIDYKRTSDKIFDGTIVWSGSGQRTYPESLKGADDFEKLHHNMDQPAEENFQIIFYQSQKAIPYDSIWNAVSNLKVVQDYMASNKMIGLFLYTPSVGIGDPQEWDYFLVLNK